MRDWKKLQPALKFARQNLGQNVALADWLPTRNSPYFTLIEPFVWPWEKRRSSLRCACVSIHASLVSSRASARP